MIQHPKKTPVITVLQKPFNDKILICFGIQSVKVHIPKKGLVYSGGDDIVVTPFKVYF